MRTAPWPSPRAPSSPPHGSPGMRALSILPIQSEEKEGVPPGTGPSDEGLASPRFRDEPRGFRRHNPTCGRAPRARGVNAMSWRARKSKQIGGRNLGRGGRADKQDGIRFQVSLGQTGLGARRRVRKSPRPNAGPTRPGSPRSTESHGSGVMGISPCSGARSRLSPTIPPPPSPCGPRASLRGQPGTKLGAGEEAGSEPRCPGHKTEASPGQDGGERFKRCIPAWAKPPGS